MWPLSRTGRLVLVLIISTLVLDQMVKSGADDLTLSADGVQCSSCGQKCSMVCGSRQFKSCCLNYVKKRTLPGGAQSDLRKESGHYEYDLMNFDPPGGPVEEVGLELQVPLPWRLNRRFTYHHSHIKPLLHSTTSKAQRIDLKGQPLSSVAVINILQLYERYFPDYVTF